MQSPYFSNESSIDSLNISADVKTAFHTAIAEGNIIYTPTQAVTYGEWNGLFYVTTNFDNEASYIIGEGLNGGYSVCGLPGAGGICNWTQGWMDYLRGNNIVTNATIISPANNQNYTVGDTINFEAQYKYVVSGITYHQWTERKTIKTDDLAPGTITLTTGYGTQVKVNIILNPNPDRDLSNIDIPVPKEPKFIEGFIDEIAIDYGVEITSFVAGVGISEGIRLITPMIAKKVGATVAGKIMARFIPVVGEVLLVGSVGAIAFNAGPLTLKCFSFSDSVDDKLLESRSPWYFCGKLTAQSLFIAAGVVADRLVGAPLTSYIARRIGISTIIRSALKTEVRTSLEVLESGNWTRRFPFSRDGEPWRNDPINTGVRLLPNNVTYTEWDVYEATSDATRGLERFARGSDGSVYYTNNHYGQVPNGEPAFYRVE
ncbi:MAG: ribonuclease domain-containing protein [Patescibacteria group bacterium]